MNMKLKKDDVAFSDLAWKEHPVQTECIAAARKCKAPEERKHLIHIAERFGQQGTADLGQGYGVSVVCGENFYSNGVNSYEMAFLKDDDLVDLLGWGDVVKGWLTEKEVNNSLFLAQRKIEQQQKDQEK